MQVLVLGAARLVPEEGPGGTPGAGVDLGGRKPRSVLASLALRLGSDVPADALVDLVWGQGAPPGAHATLHSYISGLRRVLEPGIGPRQRPTVLLTGDHGYRLDLRRDQVDAHRFADEVRALHRVLSPLASQFGTGPDARWPQPEAIARHADRLEELLGLWSGEAYADLGDHPEVVLERNALAELRLSAEEDRVLALLALGEHAVVVAATEQATSRHPLRERVWALHALALVRGGRQADALAALRHVRGVLAEELGLDPGPELRDLEQAVLVQDPALQRWAGAVGEVADRVGGTASEPTDRETSAAPTTRVTQPWATYGRERELELLHGVLATAAEGTPSCALLVGEAGVGKSRLVEALVGSARSQGFLVAVGRCSQDDGAPPLWPWTQVRATLRNTLGNPAGDAGTPEPGHGTPEAAETSAASVEERAFRMRESVAREVADQALQRPVLVVLEDLHWADTATLGVLQQLLALEGSGRRLAVVATRRRWPEPTGALAEVGEVLARAHAQRVELGGLSPEAAHRLVEAVTGVPVPAAVAASWHDRSGGNPFFLVELARLGADPDLLPATVRDVVVRRLEVLPEPTRELLVLAAVLGRRCSIDLLAGVAGRPAEQVDDDLEPARAAGLVLDPSAGVLAFTHALTRDAVATTVTPTRLARLHARVAHALEQDPEVTALLSDQERIAELARHWLAAGPTHTSRAWRAAARAAEQARASFSFVEAEELMSAAVAAHRRDPLGTPEERFELLMARAADCRPSAEWDQLLPCAAEAMALARQAGDVERLAEAAATTTHNVIWMPQQWEEVLEDVVDDLRWGLARLPTRDSVERCRLMLALAVQLYYDPDSTAELEALADEGVAMARRLADPALLWWAARAAWLALWTPSHAETRRALATEGLAAAGATGDPDSQAVALVVACGSALELGDLTAFGAAAGEAERLARARRNAYALVALLWVRLSLAAMSGDAAGVAALSAELMDLRPRRNTTNEALFLAGMQLTPGLWNGEVGPLVAPMAAAQESSGATMGRAMALLGAARAGELGLARRLLAAPGEPAVDSWASSDEWACLAEGAAVVGDVDRAAEAVVRLTPLSGRVALSGISSVLGPVDGYLSVALATCGRSGEAADAADRALDQARAWGWTAYAAWLRERREALRF